VTLFEEYKVPDFFSGGLTSLDRMTYKYVFRVNASDNLVSAAMALDAIHLGCTNAAVMFSNDENGLAELTPLVSQYKSLGGNPTTVEFNPNSTTYLTEVSQAFANNPSCLILHANQNADGAIFSAMKQLGDMRVPILGDLPGATTEMRDALGIADSVKYLYGFTGATVSSPADTAFLSAYASVYGPIKTGQVINNTAYSYYDGTIIAALAMVAAHSTDPTVWVNDVTKVSNPPGTPVYTYADGVKLLNEGKKINYEGAWGSEDFNQFHNVFSPYEVTRWNPDGSILNSYTISQAALEQLASK
jgi:ABC-type branched-subunit amino acid transport system substrate-binding protein